MPMYLNNIIKEKLSIKKFLEIWWPALVITFVIFAFHSRLFFPDPSIYITPDYGRSDSWHLSIANKFYYAQELKKNRIPIWNPHIGTGFPTLAEGQTAIFFLPNLIFFRLLPFVWAYNLTLVLSFLTAGWGIYMFCRSLGLNKLASTYAGVIFPLGGFFVFHVQHHNLLQTATLMPWLFWATNEFLNKRKIIFLLSLSFIISQQIFAGFPQITFYSLVMLSVYILIIYFQREKVKLKNLLLLAISVVFGLTLSAIQILPSYELLQVATRQGDAKNILTQFPYNFKNLLQFLDPFILGSPKNGTYPQWNPGQWGVFWENTAFVGIIPIALAIALIISNFIKRKRFTGQIVTISILLLASITLSLGKNAPLHIIYSFFPFSIFRVPSRFLLIVQFCLVLLAAIYVEKFSRKRIFFAFLTIISAANIVYYSYNYNPVGNAKKWFSKPEIITKLEGENVKRLYSAVNTATWNDVFLYSGWLKPNYFEFSRNFLDRNSNLIFDFDSPSYYESISPERFDFIRAGLQKAFTVQNKAISLENRAVGLLASNQISHILSPYPIRSSNLTLVTQLTSKDNDKIFVYRLDKIIDNPILVTQYSALKEKKEIAKKLTDPSFNYEEETILDLDPKLTNIKPIKYEVVTEKKSANEITFNIKANGTAILVASESFYPGWSVYVDSQKSQILAANVNSRAVVVPEGLHNIRFIFESKSIAAGAALTVISLLIFIPATWFFYKRKIT